MCGNQACSCRQPGVRARRRCNALSQPDATSQPFTFEVEEFGAMPELEDAFEDEYRRAGRMMPRGYRPLRRPPVRPAYRLRPRYPRYWYGGYAPAYLHDHVIEAEPGVSERVRWVQEALNRAMGLQLPVDGVLGVGTRSALRGFQRMAGLPVDGRIGPLTERALIETSVEQIGTAEKLPEEDGESEFQTSEIPAKGGRIMNRVFTFEIEPFAYEPRGGLYRESDYELPAQTIWARCKCGSRYTAFRRVPSGQTYQQLLASFCRSCPRNARQLLCYLEIDSSRVSQLAKNSSNEVWVWCRCGARDVIGTVKPGETSSAACQRLCKSDDLTVVPQFVRGFMRVKCSAVGPQ